MNQIDKQQLIDESSLDQGFYFQSLFQEACRKNLLADSGINQIQLQLVELMASEVERYTNGESSSVPVEKAQQLLQSITYSIGFFLKSVPTVEEKLELLRNTRISELFYKGMDAVSAQVKKAGQLLKDLQHDCLKINNYAYQDTLSTGISEFFHDYIIEFGAQDIPCSIDYPLFGNISNLLGVEFIYDYLVRFSLEHDFIKHFKADSVNKLLLGFDKDAEHMLINLFELILTNALGCEMLGKNITELNIAKEESRWLQTNLKKLQPAELQNKLILALKEISSKFILKKETIAYAESAVITLAGRIKNHLNTDTLDKLFLSFLGNSYIEEEITIDGRVMEDEELRNVIEEVRECSYVEQKIKIIRAHVQSLPDMTELLEECFYEKEYTEVFDMLTEIERNVLLQSIQGDAGRKDLVDTDYLKEWQRALLNYLHEL